MDKEILQNQSCIELTSPAMKHASSTGRLAQAVYSNSSFAHNERVATSAFVVQPRAQFSSMESAILLIGLEAICNAVGAGPRTIKKWMAEDGFPARRYSDGVYRASVRSVEQWFS